MEPLVTALFLSVANQKIVDYVATPVRRRYPAVDFWWLLYVALLTGALLGWFSGVNLFDAYISETFVGRLLTAVVIGGGSSLLHDIFDGPSAGILLPTIEGAVIVEDSGSA